MFCASSCSFGPNPFCTDAIYEAPVSGYAALVHAAGEVPPGADVAEKGDGEVVIQPLEAGPQKRIKLVIRGSKTVDYEVQGAPPGVAAWSWDQSPEPLRQLLEQAGYTRLSIEEMKETKQAISLALSGPKGTFLAGQTRHLRVVETRPRYERCEP
jgi:hypothetical protein